VTPRARRIVWDVAAAVVVLASAMTALVLAWPRGPRRATPVSVPASWAEYRTSPGHREHVDRRHVECSACHLSEADGFKNPGATGCVACHAREAAVMHRGGTGAEATGCLSCHAFAPTSPATPAPTCIGCHAQPHGEAGAVVQHARTDCARCHRVHESPSIVPADCTSCHDERATRHAAHEDSAGCADCHRGHAPAQAALATCSSCHAQPSGPHPAGHDTCLGCHRPHDFAAGGERACIGCHGQKPTLAAARAAPHADCTSCHSPHAPAEAAASCVKCHSGVQVAHGQGGACVTCHVPHADEPRPLALPCTTCHAQVAVVETAVHGGRLACAACHQQHAFAGLDEKTLCARCHVPEIASAATNPGHQDCRECHGDTLAHAPAAAPACGKCHASEQATAPPGHARCQECHDPHAGQPTPPCATCHANKAAGPHQSVAGGCETCHRPHGPGGVGSPPSCTTCHGRTTLPALHAASGHGDCSTCHVSSHEPPRDDRATCTTGRCHADRATHQPQAQVCTGCHVFRR
jgi:hypothetical protein